MLTCTEAARLIARSADDPAALGDARHCELDTHVTTCVTCRAALDEQRQVARMLHLRAQFAVPPGFEARLSARIDKESGGWLALGNWRAWTVGLTPVAAAFVLFAWLSPEMRTAHGNDAASHTAATAVVTEPAVAPVTFETWARSYAGSTSAAVFLEPGSGGDALLEAVLIGGAPSAGDPRDVR